MKSDISIKLCGFRDLETVMLAASLGAKYIGFVFHDKSPRNITLEIAKNFAIELPNSAKKVAVTVDADNTYLSQIIDIIKPDILQLHGRESEERVSEIKSIFKLPLIKAFPVCEASDLQATKVYEDLVDFFLFDSKTSQIGGSGIKFDWKALKNFRASKAWFLSGGININNYKEAILTSGTNMIDVSSGIEIAKGVKSKDLITSFLKNASTVVSQ